MGIKSFIVSLLVIAILAVAIFLIVGNDVSNFVNDEESILATVNGNAITIKDVKRAQQTVNLTSGEIIDQAKALEKVINERLILEEADKEKLSVTTEEAEKNLEQLVKSKGKSLDEIKASLKARGADYSEEIEVYRQQMTIGRVLKSKVKQPVITDAQTLSYFNENKDALFTNAEVPYENIALQLKQALTKKEYENLVVNYISDLRKNAEIVYLTEDHINLDQNSTFQ